MRVAEIADAEDIAHLINVAFRPGRYFADGDRINPDEVRALIHKGKFLLSEEAGKLVGCVYLEVHGERGYLGLLAIDPERQRTGLGRRLTAIVEEECRSAGCRCVDLTMVNLRIELPRFYRRLGYVENGTEPCPFPATVPCHLVRMTKALD